MMSDVPIPIVQKLEHILSFTITGFEFTSGGCINPGGKLSTTRGEYFLKWNSATLFPDMFVTEHKGIELLAATHTVAVPAIVADGTADSLQFLVLEWIQRGTMNAGCWKTLGEQLAGLHKIVSDKHGLPYNNYIGSLPQSNMAHSSWVKFFVEQRLMPPALQLNDSSLIKKIAMLATRLPEIFPEEPPSLLHGDLWTGNIMANTRGVTYLIDPAVYYGSREMEMAYTYLFGGFDFAFYKAYDAVFPLEPGFNKRMELYNLYPILVHANLFGGSYQQQAEAILKRWI